MLCFAILWRIYDLFDTQLYVKVITMKWKPIFSTNELQNDDIFFLCTANPRGSWHCPYWEIARRTCLDEVILRRDAINTSKIAQNFHCFCIFLVHNIRFIEKFNGMSRHAGHIIRCIRKQLKCTSYDNAILHIILKPSYSTHSMCCFALFLFTSVATFGSSSPSFFLSR